MVTQTVNSLLGLLILPYERGYALIDDEKELEELYAHGWPRWAIAKFPPGGRRACDLFPTLYWHRYVPFRAMVSIR